WRPGLNPQCDRYSFCRIFATNNALNKLNLFHKRSICRCFATEMTAIAYCLRHVAFQIREQQR
ncbi:hypothetical protein, partial [Pantoea eucrina]|uniref:hypothetical protein n=1 Tax=Pantoea eucrina TaxID=472693 RepID=UPI002898ED60